MKTSEQYLETLEVEATEFALSTPHPTKTGLVVRKNEEAGLIIWRDTKNAIATLEALMQNGGQPIGFISLSDDTSRGKLKVFSALLPECSSDPTANYTLSRICRDWSFQ